MPSELEHDYEIRMAHFKEYYDAGVRAVAQGQNIVELPKGLSDLQGEAWIAGYNGEDWRSARKRIEEKA